MKRKFFTRITLPGLLMYTAALATAGACLYSTLAYGPAGTVFYYMRIILSTIGLAAMGTHLCFMHGTSRPQHFLAVGAALAAIAELITFTELIFYITPYVTESVFWKPSRAVDIGSWLYYPSMALAYCSLILNEYKKKTWIWITTVCLFGLSGLFLVYSGFHFLFISLANHIIHSHYDTGNLVLSLINRIAAFIAIAGAAIYVPLSRSKLRRYIACEICAADAVSAAENADMIADTEIVADDEHAADASDVVLDEEPGDEEVADDIEPLFDSSDAVLDEEPSDEENTADADTSEDAEAADNTADAVLDAETSEADAAFDTVADRSFESKKQSLINLRDLHESGLITDTEYEKRRTEILRSI